MEAETRGGGLGFGGGWGVGGAGRERHYFCQQR